MTDVEKKKKIHPNIKFTKPKVWTELNAAGKNIYKEFW